MPDIETYDVYKAYVQNARDIYKAGIDVRRLINKSLKTDNETVVLVQTKLYALLYSMYAEASFMKMIFTPYGFQQDLLSQILSQKNVKEKWYKCIELAFWSISTFSDNIPNKKKELKSIVDSYVVEPSIIRNKIAHGQFVIAVNKGQDKVNIELSNDLKNLNSVKIYIWFEVNKMLSEIIEDLIESDTAHHNHYYFKYQRLEAFIEKAESWTIDSKLQTASMLKKVKRNSS